MTIGRTRPTEKDKLVIQHVEEYGFITIEQCKNIFYNDIVYGYDVSRVRLLKLTQSEYLKSSRVQILNSNIKFFYTEDKYKKLSLHSKLLMDYYSKLIECGVLQEDISLFKKEYTWMDGKYRSDGFIKFAFAGFDFYQIIEVIASNTDIKLKKYEDIFDSKEAHGICEGTFPRIIVIDDVIHKKSIDLERGITIIQLNHKLNNFAQIFV